MKFLFTLPLYLSFLPAFTATITHEGPQSCRTSIRHIEGGGIGYNKGYTTLEGFFSPFLGKCKVIPFWDARGHVFDDGKWAANAGMGLRARWSDRVYGINAYYDYRNAEHLHYNQIGVGLETLGTFVDARINGYLPVGKKMSPTYDTKFHRFSGHHMLLSQKNEYAMKGIDAEVGFHVGACASWNFYAATGPYYYHGPLGKNTWGGKARLSAGYKSYVTLELIESYDNVFNNQIQGQIAFSLPFGKKQRPSKAKKQPLEDERLTCRMIQPVGRNEIVVVNHKTRYPIGVNPLTNSPYYFVFVDNTSASQGTFESPYPSLLQAQENSQAGQIIYVFPGNGTTAGMNHGITLKQSQKLWGSGISYTLATTNGVITIPSMSQAAPQITNVDTDGHGVLLSTNNEVSGLTITQTSAEGIYGIDPEGFSLSSCTISACGQKGMGIFPIYLKASTPLATTFDRNVLTNNLNGGIYIELASGAPSTLVTLTNNQASNNEATTGGSAILTIDANGAVGACQLLVTGNLFTNNPDVIGVNISDILGSGAGTFNSFQASISGNAFTSNKQAITYSTGADSCALAITSNNLSNNQAGSLTVGSGAERISNIALTLTSNQMNGTFGNSEDAVDISPICDNFTCYIAGNSISNNQGSAILSFNQFSPLPNLNFVIANNDIRNNINQGSNAAGAISIDGFNALNMTIEGNTLSNNAPGIAIGFFGGFIDPPLSSATVNFQNNQLLNSDSFIFEFWGDAPHTACLTITGNTSTANPAYTFIQDSTGPCTITPCDYATENTGNFSLTGVTPSSACSGGAPCE